MKDDLYQSQNLALAPVLKFQLKERPTPGLALVVDLDGDNIKNATAVVGSVSAVPT